MIRTYRGKVEIEGYLHELIADLLAIENAIFTKAKKEGLTQEDCEAFISEGRRAASLMQAGMTMEEAGDIIRGEGFVELSRQKFPGNPLGDISKEPEWAKK